jgi:hypothetical protein
LRHLTNAEFSSASLRTNRAAAAAPAGASASAFFVVSQADLIKIVHRSLLARLAISVLSGADRSHAELGVSEYMGEIEREEEE